DGDEPLCRLAPAGMARRFVDYSDGFAALDCSPHDRITSGDAIMTADAKVSIEKLSFFYGSFRALNNVSLPLYRNKVTAFIGPSGCGKSTLLRVLNRIYEIYPNQRAEGEVLLDGQNILASGLDLNLLRAKVGMVFQKPTPFPMT